MAMTDDCSHIRGISYILWFFLDVSLMTKVIRKILFYFAEFQLLKSFRISTRNPFFFFCPH